MTKNAIPILCALFDCAADDEFSAATINDIVKIDYVHLSYSTIYNELNALCSKGYIALGCKEGHAYTYNLTEKGMHIYKSKILKEEK